jgi:hypothetical protein
VATVALGGGEEGAQLGGPRVDLRLVAELLGQLGVQLGQHRRVGGVGGQHPVAHGVGQRLVARAAKR